MKEIGFIKRINRYPVKSMKGESITSAYLTFSGLLGDRVYSLIYKNKIERPYFDIYSQKELLKYKPSFTNIIPKIRTPLKPSIFDINILAPNGNLYYINSPEFLKYICEKYSVNLDIMFSNLGMYHSRPISVLSTNQIDCLKKALHYDLIEEERFRENFIVEFINSFKEDQLINKRILIGSDAQLYICKKDHRCIYVTIDPETLLINTQILEVINKQFDGNLGVYASVIKMGAVNVNDKIYLMD